MLSGVLVACAFLGCSGKPAPATATNNTESEAQNSAANPETDAGAGTSSRSASTAKSKRGEVPLDVWFEDPVTEAGKKGTPAAAPAAVGTTVAAATPTEEMPAKTPPMEDPPAEAPAGGAGDWDTVLTSEDLQNEVKKIKLQLTDHLSAVTKYNAHYKEIQWVGAELAALGAVAPLLKDKVSWAAHAPHVRDISGELAKKAKSLGPKDFEAAKKEFDSLDQLLGGNEPAGLEEAVADMPFSETVNRRFLMHIIEQKSEHLRANFNSEEKFKKEAEDAQLSAKILALMAKMIATEGYTSAEEEEYQTFAKAMFDLSMTMSKAAQESDHAAFTTAIGQVGKYCSDCHTAYSSE